MVVTDCIYGYSGNIFEVDLSNNNILCKLYFVGNQTWFCKPNGAFDGPDPDRSDCVEDWIDDVYAKV
jgi:hypothetical protein